MLHRFSGFLGFTHLEPAVAQMAKEKKSNVGCRKVIFTCACNLLNKANCFNLPQLRTLSSQHSNVLVSKFAPCFKLPSTPLDINQRLKTILPHRCGKTPIPHHIEVPKKKKKKKKLLVRTFFGFNELF